MRATIHGAEVVQLARRWLGLTWLLLATGLLHGAAVGGGVKMQAERHFGFRVMVEGEPLEAVFTRFEVLPQWDAARRPHGFRVEVDLRGAESGVVDVDTEMHGAEWFDTQRHPLAHFRTTDVDAGTDGSYLMRGELTLKGVTRRLSIPFEWQIEPTRLRMSGAIELDRRWFGVGPEDVSSVAAEVRVSFELAWTLP